ncbi:MAG: DUF222 domain-containing protein [Ornithinimicrobium sp.]
MFDSSSSRPLRQCAGTGALAGQSNPVWQPPGEVLAARIAAGRQAVQDATTGVKPVLPRLSGDEVTAGLEDLDVLRARMETLTLHLMIEALDRGLPGERGLSGHDWLTRRCPWLAPTAVCDLLTVARGVGGPEHASIRAQVLDSTLSARRAAAVLRAVGRVRPFLSTVPRSESADAGPDATECDDSESDPDSGCDALADLDSEGGDSEGGDGAPSVGTSPYQDALHSLLSVAGRSDFTDRDLKRVTDHLANAVLPEGDHEARQKAASTLRGVNESSLGDGTLTRFVMTCEPEGAALVRAILTSPLAAPCPDETGVDPRTPNQRRYDAVVTVLKRGVAGGESAPTTSKAAVSVTIAWERVMQTFTGTGSSAPSDVLSPETVRRLACDAELIPMVLGTEREILNQGRAKRLVTPGQRRALHHRDKQCSFPGCTVPAPWCDAHHVIHWCRGGPSDLSNYALLCGRHHTLVHERDLRRASTRRG